MANKHILKVQSRKVSGRKVKQLRTQGLVPANVFGKQVKSVSIQVPAKDFEKIYTIVGESSLVYLEVEGENEPRPVLVREVSHHPVTGLTLHVDFNQVSLKEKVTAPVQIKLVGESPAEQSKLGILVQQLDEVELEALPTDMPENIEVNIGGLAAVDDTVYVKDLNIDRTKVSITSDPDQIVVKIEALAKEEVVEAPVAAEGEAAPAAEGEVPVGGEETTEKTAAAE